MRYEVIVIDRPEQDFDALKRRGVRLFEAGIFTAIIAGFLISSLGGSRVQIGGPAGAFIVIVYGIVERYGLANLLISTACAGVVPVHTQLRSQTPPSYSTL